MRNVLAGVLGAVVLAAPLAATAQRGPVVQLSTVDGRIEKISPHVHMIAAWPNAGFVVGETGVLVIDTGLGYDNGAAMARAAARLATQGQKIYLVTTHYHTEHAGGQNAFPAPATVVRARTQQAELETDGPGVVKMFASRNDEFARLLTPPQDTRADILFGTHGQFTASGAAPSACWISTRGGSGASCRRFCWCWWPCSSPAGSSCSTASTGSISAAE